MIIAREYLSALFFAKFFGVISPKISNRLVITMVDIRPVCILFNPDGRILRKSKVDTELAATFTRLFKIKTEVINRFGSSASVFNPTALSGYLSTNKLILVLPNEVIAVSELEQRADNMIRIPSNVSCSPIDNYAPPLDVVNYKIALLNCN